MNTMDGQVLELACQKYYREGHKVGFAEGHENGFEEGRELEKQRADAAEAQNKVLSEEIQSLKKQLGLI